jgi:hypothetical protein
MLKSFKFVLLIFFFIPSLSNATLLPVSDDIDDALYQTYVVHEGRDWAWVSNVNVQFYTCAQDIVNPEEYRTTVLANSGCENQMLAPEYRDGWRFATVPELAIIFNVLTLSSFYDFDNDMFIQATEYWNTDIVNVDHFNFSLNQISGEWGDNEEYETFYIRDHDSQPVPEPSTLLIFAIGLITLSSWKKLFN